MKDISNLIYAISKRPTMYVGKTDLFLVSTFLNGICFGLTQVGEKDPLGGWSDWIEQKFLISHPSWHWTRILLHEYGSDSEALKCLPKLYDEYFKTVNDIGVDGIIEIRGKKFVEHFGSDTHEPPKTDTSSVF